MTREDKLYAMKMIDLVKVAEKLGIKINTKAAKSEAVDKILAAEEMNKQNEKELKKEAEEPERLRKLREERNKAETEVLTETAKAVKKIEESILVPMPGAEKLAELKEEVQSDMIDNTVLSKFVKKAQKMITQAVRDEDGYHVTINVNGKDIFYNDKNLQNIRAAIGHIYRGEVEV